MMQRFLEHTTRSVAWIKKRADDGELEINPPFQRNPVWTDKQKSFLIDTILQGFPIPEIYMQEYSDEEGNERHVVVDGQQRIRACIEFIEGKFSIDATDSPEFADLGFEELSAAQKKILYGYNFVVRKLPHMPEADLRAMFARLNRNVVALNKQEIRHATYWGEFISCCEDISNFETWTGMAIFTPNDIRRMLDVEYISELVAAFLQGPQNKKSNLDKFYMAYESDFESRNYVESAFRRSLEEVDKILPNIEATRWRKKSDFYTLFLAFAKHERAMPFARDQREKIQQKLLDFAAKVDAFFADKDGTIEHEKDVRDYSQAVERAASDLANRKARQAVIDKLLFEAIA